MWPTSPGGHAFHPAGTSSDRGPIRTRPADIPVADARGEGVGVPPDLPAVRAAPPVQAVANATTARAATALCTARRYALGVGARRTRRSLRRWTAMTELLTRPPAATTSTVSATSSAGSVWWRGCLAAVWAVALGVAILVMLVLVVWATDSRSGAGAGQAIRFALQLWLAAHKVPLHVGPATVAGAPLGLTPALACLIARAAAVLARGHDVDDIGGVLTVGTSVGIPYAVLTAFVAAAATGPPVRPSPVAAMGCGLVVGWLAATWGAARGTIGVAAAMPSLAPVPVGR